MQKRSSANTVPLHAAFKSFVFQKHLQSMLLAAASCFASPAFALDTVTLQLNAAHSFEFSGYYAAIAQGYYADAGLSVNLIEAGTDTNPANEVDQGRAQYATGGSSLLLERNAGKSVLLLAVIMQHSPYLLAARQTQSIHDLAGKKLLLDPQAKELLAYLKNENIPPEKISTLEQFPDAQDLISGKADVISASSILQTYYLDRANFSYQIYSPRAAGMDFYGDNLFTSERELKQHPDRVKAFRTASLRGWKYAMEHADEITSLILAKYTQRHPRQFFLYQASQMQTLMHPELVEIGDFNMGRWRHIADSYAALGLLPEHYALEGFFYNQPRKFNLDILYRYTGIALAFVLLAFTFGIYIYRLKRKLANSISNGQLVEQQKSSHGKILELLGNGAPLQTVLEVIVKGAEQANPEARCSISILDSNGSHLLTGAAPSLPDSLVKALHGIEIGLGVASCGTAAFTGQSVFVDDIQTHPYWATFANIARKSKLKSCWSEPIHSANGKILGTFDIYFQHAYHADDFEPELMAKTANVAAIALDRNRANLAIKENEKMMSDILENVSAYIYMKDRQGRYLFANRLLRDMFNAPLEEIIGYDDSKFYDAMTAETMLKSDLKVLQEGETLRCEERTPNPLTGHTSVYLTIKLPLRHEDGSIYALCGIATDITEQKEIEEYMRHMAQYDVLTGLPNRALFSDRLQQAFSSAKRGQEQFAIMFIDLDKFKPINDNYGHAVGDLLLKDASQRMQSCVRESDTLARIGGDEFVVLLPSIKTEADAEEVAEKIRHALNLPFEISGHMLNISSSIGLAIYPEHGTNETDLVKNADIAMYYAKENGRNNVTFYHEGLKDTK
jgi:diguanylate cyclase (GGDEF)-like protein/PAS domain S-box-containing protein